MKRIEQLIKGGVCTTRITGHRYCINIPVPYSATSEEILEHLLEELPKPQKLTPLEYELAKHMLNEGHNWIARSRSDYLAFYGKKPTRDDSFNFWFGIGQSDGIKTLYPFVKWEDEEPTNLQELIDNCEVVEGMKI